MKFFRPSHAAYDWLQGRFPRARARSHSSRGGARRPQTKESGKLGVGGSGNLGKGPKASHSLKNKALGSSTTPRTPVPLKHPHKISSWLPSTQTQSPTRI